LQTKADALAVRERELSQEVEAIELKAKMTREITGNIALAIGVILFFFASGSFAGVNYPQAIACSKADPVCKAIRVRHKILY
jgi:cation transport ATPase